MIHNVDPQLTQWDVGRSVKVSDTMATHVHFANQGDSKAVIIEIVGGSAKIPDYLLQTGKTVVAYAVLDGVTLESKSFPVRKRERPENYVYEDDQRNYIYELITSAEDAVVNANLATQNANEAAEKANQAAKSWVIMGNVMGENVVFDDAIDQTFAGFRIFGKTTQDGVPTPDAPVDLVSVGDSGSITVNVTGESNAQSMTVATPNGLPGIPVTSGGNYTDANGQKWICDEIDFARGVYIKRVAKKVFDGTETGWQQINNQRTFRIAWNGVNGGWVGNKFIASHFVCDSDKAFNGKSGYLAIDTNGLCYFSYDKATLAEFKDWLAVNNITVLCQQASPIETPLSAEELAAYAALHTYRGNTTVSNDAGAYMDLAYTMDAKKYIDSLFVSGGVGSAAWLSTVTLLASAWKGSDSLYSQVVTIPGITEYSKVDLLPSVEQLAIFHNKDVAFATENEDGVVTVYAIGDKPTNDYTMQVSITEVVA